MPRRRDKQQEPKPETLRFTFQIQGPILRQIIDDGPRPPRDVGIEHISLWLTATQIQLGRFRRSLRSDLELFSRQGSTRKYASQRVHIDEHLLLASAANLGKALDRFGGDLPALELPPGLSDLLRHLRNVYEHWEDYKPHVANPPREGRSGRKLRELSPEAQPWAIKIWPGQDVKIACVLSVRELGAALRALRRSLPDA